MSTRSQFQWLLRLSVVFGLTAFMFMIRYAVDPLVGDHTGFVLFIPAAMAAMWFAGVRSVDLNDTLAQVVDEVRNEIDLKKAMIIADRPLPTIRGEPEIVRRVIANVVSNALKFVPANTQPRVRIWAEDGNGNKIRLNIEDNGIGIPPKYKERIFGIFERLHRDEAYPGMGIGLAIVTKGMERIDDWAGVESQPGHGSRF